MFPVSKDTAQNIVNSMHQDSAAVTPGAEQPENPSETPSDKPEINFEAAQKAAIDDSFHSLKKGDLEGFRAAMTALLNVMAQKDESEE